MKHISDEIEKEVAYELLKITSKQIAEAIKYRLNYPKNTVFCEDLIEELTGSWLVTENNILYEFDFNLIHENIYTLNKKPL
jgi:hypothetical protein